MQRRLNLPLVGKTLAALLVVAVVVHFLHAFQVGRQAVSLLATALDTARRSAQGKDVAGTQIEQALTYFHHYLSLHPQDAAARAEYALFLDRRAASSADRARVIAEMEKVLAQDPSQAKVQDRLLQNLILAGRLEQALTHVERLLPDAPKPAELHHIRGWCLEALKKYPEATQAFAKAVELQPTRISSYELWAESLLRIPLQEEGPTPEELARDVLNRMVKANAGSFRAHLVRYHFLLKHGSAADAKKDLDQAAALAPDEAAVILALAQRQLRDGDIKSARAQLERGHKLHPRSIPLTKALAGVLMNAGEREAAIGLLRAAVNQPPANPDLSVLLVELLIDTGALDEAYGRLDGLADVAVAPVLIDYLKARVAIEKKQWIDSLALLEKVRGDLNERSEWQGRMHALLGLCYQHLGDGERQMESFRRAVQREPGSPAARLGYAAALAHAGRWQEAVALLEELRGEQAKDKPRLPGLDVLFARAVLAQTLSTPEKERDWSVFEQAQRAVQAHDPSALDSPVLEAQALAARRDFDRAEKLLSKARGDQPKHASYWTLAAEIEARRNRLDRAEELLNDAAKALGDVPALRLARLQLWARSGALEPDLRLSEFARGLEKWPAPEKVRWLRLLAETATLFGSVKEAEGFLEQAAALAPRDFGSRAALVDLALQRGLADRAETLIAELREREGEEGKWWRYGTAALLIRAGKRQPEKLNEARKLIDRLMLHHADWARTALLLGRLEEARGNAEAALSHYQSAVRLGEREPWVVRFVAAQLAARKRFLEADQVIGLMEAQGPLPPELARLGTEVALALPSFDKARARALTPFFLEAGDVRTQAWLVDVYHALGEDGTAEETARKLAASQPDSADAWFTLAQQLARTDKRVEGEKVLFEAAVKVASRAAPGLLLRGHEALGDLDKAEAALLQGLKKMPGDFGLALQGAQFYLRTDQPRKAAPLLEKLLSKAWGAPREYVPKLRRDLAIALGEEPPRRGEALALLKADGKGSLESPADQRVRAFVLGMDPKHHAEAVKVFNASLKAAPATDEEMYLLARIHEASGIWFEAADALEQLLLYQPENTQFLARAALVYAKQGMLDQARSRLERLELREPGSRRASYIRKVISEKELG